MSLRVFLRRILILPAKSGKASTDSFHSSGKGTFKLHIRRNTFSFWGGIFPQKANFPESLHFVKRGEVAKKCGVEYPKVCESHEWIYRRSFLELIS